MTFDASCSLQVTQLLSQYLSTYELAPSFTEEEILHYLMPVEGVIDTHVVEGAGVPLLCRQMQCLQTFSWCSSLCRFSQRWHATLLVFAG